MKKMIHSSELLQRDADSFWKLKPSLLWVECEAFSSPSVSVWYEVKLPQGLHVSILSLCHRATALGQQIPWLLTEPLDLSLLFLVCSWKGPHPALLLVWKGAELVFGKWKPLSLNCLYFFKEWGGISLCLHLCQQTHQGPVQPWFRGQQALLCPDCGTGQWWDSLIFVPQKRAGDTVQSQQCKDNFPGLSGQRSLK